AGSNALIKHGIELHKPGALPIIEIEGIGSRGRIISFAGKPLLLRLECPRHFDRVTDAQKQRTGVLGQARGEMSPQCERVKVMTDHNGGHPGAAFRAWDSHPVYDRLDHAGTYGDRLGNLRCRDVLALPAERVTDAIDE